MLAFFSVLLQNGVCEWSPSWFQLQLVCLGLHLGVPGFFWLLFVLRWCTRVWVGSFHTPTTLSHSLSLRWRDFSWRFPNRPSSLPHLPFSSKSFPLCSRESLGLQSNCWDACNQSLIIWRSCGKLWFYNLHLRLLWWQVGRGICSLFRFWFIRVHFGPTSTGETWGQHWQRSLCQCKVAYSGMSPGFPEAPLGTHHPCAIHPFSTD